MNIILILVSILHFSCDVPLPSFWNDNDNEAYVWFSIGPEKDDTFREIRIYCREIKDGKVLTFDSTFFNANNWDGTYETFRKNRGVRMSFVADSFLQIKNGWFEAVALRKDSVLIEQRFGQIWNGTTHQHYNIILAESVILVEE